MKPHVMVDTETLGISCGVVSQISFVAFMPDSGEVVEFATKNVLFDDCLRAGMRVDEGTIRFWLEQGPEARQSLSVPAPIPLTEALGGFVASMKELEPELFWAFPSDFDFPILETAFRLTGLEMPWHYRAKRCARTLIAASGMTRDEMQTMADPNAVKHVSLDDCKNQIRWLMEAAKRLGVPLR